MTGQECVSFNASGGGYYYCTAINVVTPMAQTGDNCTNSGNYSCIAGASLCINPQFPTTFCNSLLSGCVCLAAKVLAIGQNCSVSLQCAGNATCDSKFSNLYDSCVGVGTQANGQQCNHTYECTGPYSRCLTFFSGGNNTCTPIIGSDCATAASCGGSPQWDCSCSSRTCYLLNAPTPLPTPNPSPPAPTPDPCAAKSAAWLAAKPKTFPGLNPQVAYYDWDSDQIGGIIQAALHLPNASVPLLIDYVCCYTCPYAQAFQVSIWRGYQVDCASRRLVKLNQDQCNKKKASLAFLNCWKFSISSGWAPVANFGLLALLTIALF